jgi:hypothetical protein
MGISSSNRSTDLVILSLDHRGPVCDIEPIHYLGLDLAATRPPRHPRQGSAFARGSSVPISRCWSPRSACYSSRCQWQSWRSVACYQSSIIAPVGSAQPRWSSGSSSDSTQTLIATRRNPGRRRYLGDRARSTDSSGPSSPARCHADSETAPDHRPLSRSTLRTQLRSVSDEHPNFSAWLRTPSRTRHDARTRAEPPAHAPLAHTCLNLT